MSTTREQILAALKTAGTIISQVTAVAAAAGFPVAGAVSTGIKIAIGLADNVPQALALWDQFQNNKMPTVEELAAYEAAEDSAYATLMAEIDASIARQKANPTA